jgi:hypothetical protein
VFKNHCFVFRFRGDHIVPNFEEIWPSKKGPKANKPKTGLEYYYDAMMNGPNLSGIDTSRVDRWFISKPKIPIWVNFGGNWNGNVDIHILWTFGLFYGHLVYFIAIWYILR